MVLVPFYRGAVVFESKFVDAWLNPELFSSPFIEERLYFNEPDGVRLELNGSSRPLLSRSGCI